MEKSIIHSHKLALMLEENFNSFLWVFLFVTEKKARKQNLPCKFFGELSLLSLNIPQHPSRSVEINAV